MTSKFLCSMYNKTIIVRFGCCDIPSNEGLGKGYQLQLKVEADIVFPHLPNCLLDNSSNPVINYWLANSKLQSHEYTIIFVHGLIKQLCRTLP